MSRVIYRMLLVIVMMSVFNAAQALTPRQVFDVEAPEKAYGPIVKYNIFRNNKPAGEHTVKFHQTEAGLQVLTDSRIVVSVLKIPVFRMSYSAEEIWQYGKLVSVSTVIVEQGKTKRATLKNEGAQQTLVDIKGRRTRASLEYTSNHWHPGALESNTFFNTLTGRANRYTVVLVGSEILNVGGTKINATRYRYSGPITPDVWYDEQGRWVKLQFAADDGSTIEYRLAAPFNG